MCARTGKRADARVVSVNSYRDATLTNRIVDAYAECSCEKIDCADQLFIGGLMLKAQTGGSRFSGRLLIAGLVALSATASCSLKEPLLADGRTSFVDDANVTLPSGEADAALSATIDAGVQPTFDATTIATIDAGSRNPPALDAAVVTSPTVDAAIVISPTVDAAIVISPTVDAAVVISPTVDAANGNPLAPSPDAKLAPPPAPDAAAAVVNPLCGNGILDSGEVCDDGNTTSGDGCSADCSTVEFCGDGVVDPGLGETCDDGNNVGGDGCSTHCHLNADAVAVVTDECDFAAFGSFSCALLDDTTVKCWGINDEGQLGDGTTTTSSAPVTVSGLSGVTALYPQDEAVCASKSDGTLWCWGRDNAGQLGDGGSVNSSVPVQVQGLDGVEIQQVMGHQYGMCALDNNNQVWCWGDLWGDPWQSSTPIVVLNDVQSLDGGGKGIFHLTLTTGESVFLGNAGWGAADAQGTPMPVPGFETTPLLATGAHDASYFIDLSDGSVYGWGRDDGHFARAPGGDENNPTPVRQGSFSGAVKIQSPVGGACALLADHSLRCWGWGYGGSSNVGPTLDDYTNIFPRHDVYDFAMGWDHGCMIDGVGRVWCWGNDPHAVGPQDIYFNSTFAVEPIGY